MEQGGCQLPSLPLARIGKRREYRLEIGSSSFSSSTSFFSPALWRQHLFQLVVATSRDRYAESVALAQPSCLFVRHRFFLIYVTLGSLTMISGSSILGWIRLCARSLQEFFQLLVPLRDIVVRDHPRLLQDLCGL